MNYYVQSLSIVSNPKFQREPVFISRLSTSLGTNTKIGAKVDTSQLYQDWYKRINLSHNNWNLSFLNTGTGVIGGTLTENNNPISDCFLYLYQSSTGMLAKQTISDKDGNFKFTGLVPDITYFVVGVHKTKKFNSVILDEVRIDSAL